MEEVELTFTEEALQAIAQKAIERKTGARGLRSIIENLLLDSMFEVPDREDVTEVVVNDDTVKESKNPVYVLEDKKKKKSKSSKKEDSDDDSESEELEEKTTKKKEASSNKK